MGILTQKRSPWEREYQEVWRREQWYLRRYSEKRESVIDRKVEELAPAKLMETLHKAFEKAFALVFEKGTGVILKMGRRDSRRETCRIQTDAVNASEDRSSLKAFSKTASRSAFGNVAVSGAAGVSMGLFGVALPDIPFFTAMMLKSVYEVAESYGFPCDNAAEQLYVLRVVETALSDGEKLKERNRDLDVYAQTGFWPEETDRERQISATARQVSEAVLLGKALQNIPVAGAVGGVADAVYLSRIRKYAAIKYQKRFLICRRVKS